MSAHPKADERTGELLFFNYSKEAPYMKYGVVDDNNELAHYVIVPLPGPRLPHDMAFTENYAVLNDFPLFWDREAAGQGVHAFRSTGIASRFALVPRHGGPADPLVRGRADLRAALVNAYEDGDEIVLDGFFQGDPSPATPAATAGSGFRYLALDRLQARLHRWRFNLNTGTTRSSS